MFLGDNARGEPVHAPVRVSVQHLDPSLYDRLEAGDELVVYRNQIELPTSAFEAVERFVAMLHARQLSYEEIDDSPTRLVWLINDAEPAIQASAAE